jgi:hypothetical protein
MIESPLYTGTQGLPYVSNALSDTGDEVTGYGAGGLWAGVDTNICISSTAWYIFGRKGFDPFALNREKSIPEADKFWL